MTAMFVNLPVTDLERSKAFYTAIGFTINPLFSDHNGACVVVEDGHSYGELAAGLPRIPSNILAARLKELQAAGILRRVPHSRVIVYELTPYGRELEPVVLALGAWGFKALGEPREEQVVTPDSMTMALRTAFRPQVAATLPTTSYAARFGPADLLIRVDGPALDVTRGHGPADLAFAAGPDFRRLISGELSADHAISTGVVEVLHGRSQLLGRFADTFHLAA